MKVYCYLFLICVLALMQITNCQDTFEENALKPKRKGKGKHRGKCSHLWRPDNLPGKCFGLKSYSEYDELKDIKRVLSWSECRSLCCLLGEQCVTWQYQNATAMCKLGPAVRLGFEGADTPNWCDPLPPSKWNGNRLALRRSDGSCEWGQDLPSQCFGLGPERVTEAKEKLSNDQCKQKCCEDKKCEVYQQSPERGCYFNEAKDVWCSKEEFEYNGGRKCVPGFCGGKEKEYLGVKTNSLEI